MTSDTLNDILNDEETSQESETTTIVVDLTDEEMNGESEIIEQQEESVVESNDITWFHNLSEVEDELEIVEFEQYRYLFRKVSDPTGESSDKFLVFYKDHTKEEPKWETLVHLLSNQYTVALTEAAFENTVANMEYGVTDIHVNSVPFRMVVSAETSCPINLFEEESMKLAFQIVTGINPEQFNNVSSKVLINIINTYNGTKKINRSYEIKTVANRGNEGDLTYRDYFLISTLNESFIHNESNLGGTTVALRTAQQALNNNIHVLSNITEGVNDIVEYVKDKLSKEERNSFIDMWENIPAENKSLLMFIVLISHVLEKSENINKIYFSSVHHYVQSLITQKIRQAANI